VIFAYKLTFKYHEICELIPRYCVIFTSKWSEAPPTAHTREPDAKMRCSKQTTHTSLTQASADQRRTNAAPTESTLQVLSPHPHDHVSTLAAVPGGVGVNIGRGGVFLMWPGPDEEKDSSEDRGTWVLSGSIVDGPAWDGVPAATRLRL
jgi:hypothetical protein